ncbi:MAG: hydantoinase B/oxoprolinase family protein [Actinomycetota bacterium]
MPTDEPSRPTAPWRIGVDVGGTFTDLVLADAEGRTWVSKVPSVPTDPSRGVLDALERMAVDLGLPTAAVLADCAHFVHGSTIATNTMLEGKGATVGLLCTEGFRDVIEIRRGLRDDQWNHRAPYAPPLVPRYLRQPVPERVDADGTVHRPLDTTDLDATLRGFEDEGVESIAIALMNGYANDAHEQELRGAVAERWSGDWVTTSAAVSPLMGEYERTSTAVVNATLMPRIVGYLRSLEADLHERGLTTALLLVQSNGGAASVEQLADRPVNLLLSGPAAAVGALNLYSSAVDDLDLAHDPGHVISMEIGGTSCDVLLMANREVATRDETSIAGYLVSTPAIDIHTIGAGGGTIARVDDAGLLVVGPEGAGADPGPASYGRGGTEPTVTDAHLVLGRLRPGKSAGGTLDLDLDAAVEAIRTHVAEPLDMTVEAAAAGIIELTEQHLLSAVEHISIERGHSPRRFPLVAAGGAGPMHGAQIAAGLGSPTVYIPRAAGALCAIGMLHADIRQDFTKVLVGSLDTIERSLVTAGFDDLRDNALGVMAAEGIDAADVDLRYELELHHPGQIWSVRVRLDGAAFDPAAARASFEEEYQRLYGHVQPDGTIMLASLRLIASASTGAIASPVLPESAESPVALANRSVFFGDDGWCDSDVYDGARLRPGARIAGPALVEELTTTVVVRPRDELFVDPSGDFVIELDVLARTAEPVAEEPSTRADMDPIILALMQNRLDQITRHMGWVMTRTARSTIFSQSHDFSCFITTPDGTLVANADGIPIHTGGGGFAVRAVLDRFAGRIEPEDVFLLSDPYVAGGNHLPDWVIARPIFVEDTLVGFCCNRAHQNDIGGGLAGTYNPQATEIWQEGIRLPVLKLIEQGRVRDDLWELLLINCRTPELLDGDLLAMIGSTRIGGERVQGLVHELGEEPYLRYLDGVLDHADRRLRTAVRAMPDGVFHGEDHSDNDCFEARDIAVRVALTIDGDEMTLDFTGSDDQIEGFKNSSLANTYSSAYLAISSFFDTTIPRNEGTYRGVTIIAPEGSIVNALPPAPMTMNTVYVAHEIVIAVWQALAQAAPERACAAWSKTMHGHVAGKRDDGTTWVMYHWHAMGTPGATAERDGFAQMGHLISLGGLDIPNLEFHEQQFPVRYVRHEQRCDNAGPGLRRGGTGVVYEADVLEPAIWSFRAEGLGSVSGHGVQGGGEGGVGHEWIDPVDEDRFTPPKYGVQRLGPARMIAWTPGGGGWGDAFERPVDQVLRDVRDGVVSIGAAASDYGVAIDADTLVVDDVATAALRQR